MCTRILGILMSRGFLLKDIQLTFLNRNLFLVQVRGNVRGNGRGESGGAINVRVLARLR